MTSLVAGFRCIFKLMLFQTNAERLFSLKVS